MSAVPVLSRLAGVGVLAAAVVTVPAAAAAPTVDGLGGAYAAICDEEEVHGGARPAPGQPDKERNTLTTAEARALDRTLDRKMERPVNQRQSARVQQQAVVVDVVIHEVQGSDGTGAVSDATWDAQIDELNENFAGGESAEAAETGFRFNLLDVREYTNDRWFNRVDKHGVERDMKRSTRVGGYDVMNVWSTSTSFLGYAYYPTDDKHRLATAASSSSTARCPAVRSRTTTRARR